MYRDHQFAARCRRRQVQRERASGLPRALQHLYACRLSRIWASIAGLAGFGALLLDIFLGGAHLTQILFLSWMLVAASSCTAWLVAGGLLRRRTKRTLPASGDPLVDLIRLEHGSARAQAIEMVRRLEQPSLALPLVCLSLLTPLSLHMLVAVGLLGVSVDQFNSWILLSLVLVGHAHAALAVLSVRHVSTLRWALDTGNPVVGGSRGALAVLWAVSVSTVPGALLLFVPPLLVATTGVLFVPLIFHWAARRAVIERQVLAAALEESRG